MLVNGITIENVYNMVIRKHLPLQSENQHNGYKCREGQLYQAKVLYTVCTVEASCALYRLLHKWHTKITRVCMSDMLIRKQHF